MRKCDIIDRGQGWAIKQNTYHIFKPFIEGELKII